MTDNAEITNPSLEEENVPIVTFKRGKMRSRANLRTKENSDNEDEDKAKALVQSRAVATVLSESSTGTTITNSDSAVPSISSLATVFQSSNNADRFEYSGSSATATNQVESTDKNLTGGKQSQSKQGGAFGPMKAPSFLRATSRFDYQPNICKDYKETGFCGFGDSCIYLHDRSDYKAGWQLEKEWEVKQAAKKRKMQELENAMSKARAERRARREGKEGEEGEFDEIEEEAEEDVMKAIRAMQEEKEEEEKEEDGGRGGQGKGKTGEKEKDKEKEKEKELPFACFICRNPFTQPIVTSCGHYFCSQCAIDRYKTNTRCAVCDKPTFGIFNAARKLLQYSQRMNKGDGK